jgi:hypothetical protein
MPRTISEPLYSPATNIRAIAVHGVRGQHPADQAVWYLEHGYHVYDADSRLPLEYRARSSTGQKELVTVTHPLGHNVRTRLPQPEPHPFDLGQWPNVYSSQIREVDRVGHQWKDVTQSDRGAPQINIRRWPVSVNPNVTNRNRSLSIETANQETMEPAEVHCRDYLANCMSECACNDFEVLIVCSACC